MTIKCFSPSYMVCTPVPFKTDWNWSRHPRAHRGFHNQPPVDPRNALHCHRFLVTKAKVFFSLMFVNCFSEVCVFSRELLSSTNKESVAHWSPSEAKTVGISEPESRSPADFLIAVQSTAHLINTIEK